MFNTLKDLVSTTIEQLDELTDEKKWKEKAQKGLNTLKTGVDTLAKELTLEPSHNSKLQLRRKSLDFTAGFPLLNLYDAEWESLHQHSEKVARRATDIDEQIRTIAKVCGEHHNRWSRFYNQITLLPQLTEAVQKTSTLIDQIYKRLEVLEVFADEFEMGSFKKEITNKQHEVQSQHEDYVSQKRRELKAREFTLKKKYEEYDKEQQIERRMKYEEAFEKDMNEYIKEPPPTKPRSISVGSAVSVENEQLREILANINIETKPEEQAELQEFLSSLSESNVNIDQLKKESSLDPSSPGAEPGTPISEILKKIEPNEPSKSDTATASEDTAEPKPSIAEEEVQAQAPNDPEPESK